MQTPGAVFRDVFSQNDGAWAHSRKSGIVLDATHKQHQDLTKRRLVMICVIFVFIFGGITARLGVLGHVAATTPKTVKAAYENPLMIARPDLVDRNGVIMAQDLTTFSLHANPQEIRYPAEVLAKLNDILPGLKQDQLMRRLKSNAEFVWIKRELTPTQHKRILDEGIPGLHFDRETRRFYPDGETASHLVGFVDVDNKGLAGFEQFVDGHFLDDLRSVGLASRDRMAPVPLSINMDVQHVVRDELVKAMRSYRAKAAVGVVMDAKTGEVIAMSSLPDYDPNRVPETLNKQEDFNRATGGLFELGSVVKAFTTAMALDSGRVRMEDSFDARKPLKQGRFTIRDFHAKRRILTVSEIFKYSSNIGTAKMAMRVGLDGHREFLTRIGLLKKATHELPEKRVPQSPKKWKTLDSMVISFGHSLQITPLQAVSAAAAMLNGGKLIPATFQPRTVEEANAVAQQVISPETSAKMRYLFRLNVEEGSGKRAEVEGYFVGGKTGTAEKVVNGRYSKTKKLNSFLSAFPIQDPRYVMLVMIDEPKPLPGEKAATAGLNAAPTTAAIIRRIATTLRVLPKVETVPTLIEIDYRR